VSWRAALIRTRAAAMTAAVVPDWLAEVVRPKPVALPWPEMIRAVLAICVPLAASLALGKGDLGVLPAMGGIIGTMVDTGGPYLSRVKRVASAAVFGGALGLTIGSVTHGHGWLAVLALIAVAGISGVLSSLGDVGSVTGLQLLVYTALGDGPIGALRPVWHTAAGFLVGVIWALILILPGWLRSPYGKEQRDVAAVYTALAAELSAVGTDGFTARRWALTGALNTAYDELLTVRSNATGRNMRTAGLATVLNASHPMIEAATEIGLAGSKPPPLIIDTVARLGDAVAQQAPPPMIPPPWDTSPAMLTLRDAMAGAARALARDWSPEDQTRSGFRERLSGRLSLRARLTRLADRVVDEFGGGRLTRIFTLRLMACMGVAALVIEVLPLQRSYWVLLTVAIVLKPDYGSVFARALQRGLGTVVGAVAGAILLVLVHGLWLLIPFAVLAALLPYGRSRNYGLLATFLTPLVVVLIDLLAPAGWRLAEDRLVDTLIGCAIVLLVGFAPWPMSWYAHLPREFAQAALDVCDYMREALSVPEGAGAGGGAGIGAGGSGAVDVARPPVRSRMRRSTYQALADLRIEFQRTMSEPPSISRRAAAWWPAVVALEQVMDAVTATAGAVSRGAKVPASGVAMLAAALRAVSEAAATGTPLTSPPELPSDDMLKSVTEAVRALLSVLGSGPRLVGDGV
jgi:uncharacterized membrane protein YccC